MHNDPSGCLTCTTSSLVPVLVGWKIKDSSIVPPSFVSEELANSLSAQKYWEYVRMEQGHPDDALARFAAIAQRCHSCPPSSAGVERLFSGYALTQTTLRNRLSNERVRKLVAVRRFIDAGSGGSGEPEPRVGVRDDEEHDEEDALIGNE